MARSSRLLSAIAGVLLVPAAIACNGIVGLSDYSRAECSGGEACEGAPDASKDVTADRGPDVVTVDASGTGPVSWAKFKMPNYAHDGGPTENLQSYTPIEGGFVDNVSKLAWQEPIDRGEKSWEEAQRICAQRTVGGRWRLPSRIELVTLLNLSRAPTIDPTVSSTEGIAYWTSSEVRPFGVTDRKRWAVQFGVGGVVKLDESAKAGVRCIKDR